MAINTLDLLARKTAVLTLVPESLVEIVIRHKWNSVHEALGKYNSVEDSGLGKFKIRKSTLLKKEKIIKLMIDKQIDLISKEEDERKKQTLNRRLNSLYSNMEYIKTKLNAL